ncbi:MAG: hypothetical protein ACKVQW_13185 [Pyrinomonadaceae bacterium]
MKTFLLGAIILLSLSVISSAQNKSIYTSTTEKSCKAQKASNDEGGDYIGICPGVGGYKLKLIEGDLRQTLYVITPRKKEHPLRFNEFYYSFSAIGEKIEWRLRRGVPVALIARYNVADPEDSEKRTSYLMIVKITKSFSCVTDVVLPGTKQNETARKLADANSIKPCKIAE